MALDSGRAITRYSWTEIPLPQLVIDKVDSWGADQPSLLTFVDRKRRPIGDSDQITGVYGDDPTTPVLDLTPIDMDIPPLHPLPVDEEAHLSDEDIESITDPLTAPIASTTSPVDEPTNPLMEYPTVEPTVAPTNEPLLDETPPTTVPLEYVPPVDTVAPVETAGVRCSTRLCTAPRSYTPGFHGKTYTNHLQLLHPDTHLSLLTHEAFATPTDPQVLATIMTQLSLKAGLKAWGDKASAAVHSEMKQLHFRDTFEPKHWKDLNETQRKSVLESHMFLKEKRDGKIKGQTVAGGNKQRDHISKEDASSPTVATEAVLLTCIIDAEDGRDVAVVDIPNAFIQTKIENESDMAIIKLRGILVDMLLDIAPNTYQPFVTTSKAAEKQLIVQCKNAIYGTMVASLLYYKKFSKSLISYGFEFNPYDPCVANKMIDGSQLTICFHVDDCKLSHVSPKVMDDMIAWLKQEYESIFEDSSGQMVVSRGKTHKYLGMTLDYTTTGQVKITMFDYVQEIIDAFDEADPSASGIKTSAAPEDLFKINENSPKLESTLATAFHTLVAKILYCTKRARPDTSTAIAFLTTRVREPDVEDWAKLSHLMQYL
jgi:hypothetical protein